MAIKVNVAGIKIKRGNDLKTSRGWMLVRPSGRRALKASLPTTLQVNGESLAVFRVLR
jgi:hypothetical protein